MKNLFIFTAGVAIGSAVTYFIVKDKFEKIAQEEIDSVKEVFGRKVKEETDKMVEKEVDEIKKEYNQYNNYVENYSLYSEKVDKELDEKYENQNIETEPTTNIDQPYIISPEEFGVLEGYSMIDLTYYADGFLADDCDELVEDIDEVVGEDFAEHFGEYEEDAVYIRNDRLKADYEILRDLRNYSDVVWCPPHQMK